MNVKIFFLVSILIFATSSSVRANSLTITPNSIATASATELVTVGIPFTACTLVNLTSFKLLDELSREVPVFVKQTLSWHSRNACPTAARAIKVQFAFDATAGVKTYVWNLDGRTTENDLTEQAVTEIVTDRDSIKGSFNEPRVFAINDPAYVVASGLLPPTSTQTTSTFDDNFFPEKWEYDARDFDYTTSTASNWLFDRVSTNYKQAIRRGDVEYYREAYLSHEFWSDKVETTGTNTSVADYCVGGFDMDKKSDTFGSGGAGCDPKYIYSEPFKLHLALTGDDSWLPTGPAETTRNGLFLRMADTLYAGSERCPNTASCQAGAIATNGFSSPYVNIGDAYTERKAGFGLQTMLNICELTGDSTTCDRVDSVVNNMYLHMTANPDGLGNTGYLGHSWHLQEGSFIPYIGMIDSSTTGTSLTVNRAVEDLSLVLAPNMAIRVKATASGGASTSTNMTSLTGGASSSWVISIEDALSVAPPNSVKGGDEGGGNVNYLLKSDRVFSPWTQSIIADGLWQYYNWTENSGQKDKAKELIVGFANTIAAYAVDGTRINPTTKSLIESAYGVTVFDSGITGKIGCGLTVAPYTRYVANTLMGTSSMNSDYAKHMFVSGGFSDQHIPEALFQLSLGIHFETDVNKKIAMQALAADTIDYFDMWSCTSGNKTNGSPLNDPPRAYSWQNKSDPFGTYRWVLGDDFVINYSRALPPGGLRATLK
jgi:hypothetical protein